MKRPTLLLITALVSLLAAACGSSGTDELVGYDIKPYAQVGQYVVEDAAAGRSDASLKADPGELLIVFLGFTNCPDACPIAMANIRTARGKLGADAARVDVAMLTVDPERDTSAVLTPYVRQFAADGRALRTDDAAELKQITSAFSAGVEITHDHGTSMVGHTDYTYLVDDTGAVVLTWTAEMTPNNIASDLRKLLRTSPKSD